MEEIFEEKKSGFVVPSYDEPDIAEDNTRNIAVSNKHRVRISNEEWQEISLALENHHAVFYKIWQMGKPIFNEEIETAAVQFDETGEFVWFHFNPKMWKRLDFYNKLFVICHEAMHIILNHGIRTRDAASVNRKATNVALDVVVNHLLVNGLDFDRNLIEGWQDFCWIDTTFKDKNPLPPEDETYEYYYGLFDKIYGYGGPGDGDSQSGTMTVDDHSMLGDKSDKWDKVIDNLNKSLSDEEKESLKGIVEKHFQKDDPKEQKKQQAGTETGGQWYFANTKKAKKKKKWETIIKKWARKYRTDESKEIEQWARLNRRMAMLPKDLFLPSDMETDEREDEKRRIKVYFFLDTSGSCIGLKDRFWAAAESLPENRFDVRLFCFDTVVQETTLSSKKIYGGGGTSFKILEDFVQKEIAQKNERHPEAVFVITDGYGDQIKPQKPKSWYWFITERGVQSYIDNNCNFFNLSEFE